MTDNAAGLRCDRVTGVFTAHTYAVTYTLHVAPATGGNKGQPASRRHWRRRRKMS